MLIIFEDIKNNLNEIYLIEDDTFNMENITDYQYNIYKDIIPQEEIHYLIKIKSTHRNLNKFFTYKKNHVFNMYLLSAINYLPMENIENSKKKTLLDNLYNKKQLKSYFTKNDFIKIYEVSFEDISLCVVSRISYFTLHLKLTLKDNYI